LKTDLSIRFDYSTYSAFRSLDSRNDGFVDLFNLKNFFRNHSSYPSDREILAIIRRIDTNGDAKITFSEFSDILRSEESAHRQIHRAEESRMARSYSQERAPLRASHSGSFYSPGKTGGFGASNRAHSAYGGNRGGYRGFDSPAKQTSFAGSYGSGFKQSYGGAAEMRTSFRRGGSPLRLEDEDELAFSLKEQLNLERELESAKIRLV